MSSKMKKTYIFTLQHNEILMKKEDEEEEEAKIVSY